MGFGVETPRYSLYFPYIILYFVLNITYKYTLLIIYNIYNIYNTKYHKICLLTLFQMMKNVLFLANDQHFENDWKNVFDMCLAWCYIYVWLLIYYVSVFICSSTDIWCKIINISCIYLHYLQSYDYLNICIIIYWNILEYIQRWRVMLKKKFSAERVKHRNLLINLKTTYQNLISHPNKVNQTHTRPLGFVETARNHFHHKMVDSHIICKWRNIYLKSYIISPG